MAKTAAQKKPAPKKPARTVKKPATKKRKSSSKKPIVLGWKHILAAVVVLGLFIAVPYLYIKIGPVGAFVPEGYTGFCIDVSHYQKTVAWDSLRVMVDRRGHTTKNLSIVDKVYPVKRVIIKATEGESMKDEYFARHWAGAQNAGLIRGAYHFYVASKDPSAQALNFLMTVGTLHASDLAPVLDVEAGSVTKKTDREKLNKDLRVWLEHVQRITGRKPVIYTNDKFLAEYLDEDLVEDYPVWIARYSIVKPSFKDWTMWQFTDRALVYGIPDPVDLSVIK